VNEIVLTMKAAPALRVDMRGVTPAALAAMGDDAIAHHKVWHGNQHATLGDLFGVTVRSRGEGTPVLRLIGDLTRFDHIGCGLDAGRISIEGGAGDYVGLQMTGGEIDVGGSVGLFAGCEMAGGRLHVQGSVGDFAAGALPGSMDGMRGGDFIVRGNAGARLGDRMRRGLLAVFGNAGDFAASRLVAGTIAIGGSVGAHPAFGMRRGTVVLATAKPDLPPTFVATAHDIGVFWHLLATELRKVGGVFEALPAKAPLRMAGDLAVDGRGEMLFPA
jgi:formylmethanofuran dehydrogenase subunit C